MADGLILTHAHTHTRFIYVQIDYPHPNDYALLLNQALL